jgi:hypothetical protein
MRGKTLSYRKGRKLGPKLDVTAGPRLVRFFPV